MTNRHVLIFDEREELPIDPDTFSGLVLAGSVSDWKIEQVEGAVYIDGPFPAALPHTLANLHHDGDAHKVEQEIHWTEAPGDRLLHVDLRYTETGQICTANVHPDAWRNSDQSETALRVLARDIELSTDEFEVLDAYWSKELFNA